ncbi:MAG: hypothetical protein J6Z34_01130 [Clostridia bacterium]|nr:hypothetical protein [Clostridia bacterium]
MKFIEIFTKKSKRGKIGLILLAVAEIFALIELILYITTGATSFNAYLPKEPIILLSIGIAIGLISIFYSIRALMFGGYLCFFAGFVLYIVSQLSYIVNVIDGRDGYTLSSALIAALVVGGLAFLLMLAAAILTDKDSLSAMLFKEGNEQ